MTIGQRQDSALPAMTTPHRAVAAMLQRVQPVGLETIPVGEAAGRVLGRDITADRDSPAADVSSMDGYALRHKLFLQAFAAVSEGEAVTLPLAFAVQTGRLPATLPEGWVAQVFTGGVLPPGSDTVIRREDTEVVGDSVVFHPRTRTVPHQQFVRHRGENARVGDVLLEAGQALTPAACVTLASRGLRDVEVHRRVRVALLISGNELERVDTDAACEASQSLDAARVRDSNGPALRALLGSVVWCDLLPTCHVADDLQHTAEALASLSREADIVLCTGGVSMGDHDVIPQALVDGGAEVVYHHLAMRPGKPNLGAVFAHDAPASAVAVLALPGNPVSVLVGAVVLAGPVLRRRAGLREERHRPRVRAAASQPSPPPTLTLWQYVPACINAQGLAVPVAHRGSGDVVALGRSQGFFELPPTTSAVGGDWPWHEWSVEA